MAPTLRYRFGISVSVGKPILVGRDEKTGRRQLIPILSGFVFDMTKKKIGWKPLVKADPFRTFWSLDAAWGRVEICADGMKITVLGGELPLCEIVTALKISSVTADGAETAFAQEGNTVRLAEETVVRDSVMLKV